MNLDITKYDHFKLYILPENRFTFENELRKNNIDFFVNLDEQIGSSHSIRYYLKDSDRLKIDKLIKENDINSAVESSGLVNFYDNKSIVKLILIVIISIVLILIVRRIV